MGLIRTLEGVAMCSSNDVNQLRTLYVTLTLSVALIVLNVVLTMADLSPFQFL